MARRNLLLAGCGIAYAIVTTLRMFRLNWADGLPDMSDKCFYGIFPAIAYVLLAATGVAVWLRPEAAVYSTGAVMLILLLIGIRNAWDLATFFVLRDPDKKE